MLIGEQAGDWLRFSLCVTQGKKKAVFAKVHTLDGSPWLTAKVIFINHLFVASSGQVLEV